MAYHVVSPPSTYVVDAHPIDRIIGVKHSAPLVTRPTTFYDSEIPLDEDEASRHIFFRRDVKWFLHAVLVLLWEKSFIKLQKQVLLFNLS